MEVFTDNRSVGCVGHSPVGQIIETADRPTGRRRHAAVEEGASWSHEACAGRRVRHVAQRSEADDRERDEGNHSFLAPAVTETAPRKLEVSARKKVRNVTVLASLLRSTSMSATLHASVHVPLTSYSLYLLLSHSFITISTTFVEMPADMGMPRLA